MAALQSNEPEMQGMEAVVAVGCLRGGEMI